MSGERRATLELPFVKMEGCGNDYVYVDLDLPELATERERLRAAAGSLARLLADRHFGVGGDGLVLVTTESVEAGAYARMWMYNADGSEGSVCGNALRCVALYLGETRSHAQAEVRIETAAGPRCARRLEGGRFVVDMGEPVFVASRVPFVPPPDAKGDDETGWRLPLRVGALEVDALALSLGNPHLVVPVAEGLAGLDLDALGPPLEKLPAFPERANVEFISRAGPARIVQRTWERGSGETLACGSGACAATVAAIGLGWVPRADAVTVDLRGGRLEVCWHAEGSVSMTGPARRVFDGVSSIPWPLPV